MKSVRSLLSELWIAAPWRVFSAAVLLVPLSMLAGGVFALVLEQLSGSELPSSSSARHLSITGITGTRLFTALLLAPVMENGFCLLWSAALKNCKTGNWWTRPAVIALIAGAFHVIGIGDIRSAAVLPGFFVMVSLIDNVVDKRVGYWASVLHHILLNGVALMIASVI